MMMNPINIVTFCHNTNYNHDYYDNLCNVDGVWLFIKYWFYSYKHQCYVGPFISMPVYCKFKLVISECCTVISMAYISLIFFQAVLRLYNVSTVAVSSATVEQVFNNFGKSSRGTLVELIWRYLC